MPLLAYVDMGPLMACGNVLLVGLFLTAAVVLWVNARPRLAVTVAVVPTGASAVFWISMALFTGVHQTVTVPMTWSYGKALPKPPYMRVIELRFVSHPSAYVGIYSDELGRYLESLPGSEVEVQFDVTTDFGRTRGFRETRIGGLHSWDETHPGYAGGGPFPF